MPKCRDCLHWEVCHEYQKAYWGHKAQYSSPIVNASADSCTFYKYRSNWVRLPVNPREKIFYFDTAGRIYESTVTQLIYGATGFLIDSDVMFNSNLIGERFFFTREEAEQALKERENSD